MTTTETQARQALDVRPQSGWTGAEIHGVDLTKPLRSGEVAEIRAALLKWKVVFFRDQFIDHDDHLRFASAFGAPTPAHPLFDSIPDPNYPTIYPIFRDRFKARYGTSRGFDKPQLARRRDCRGQSARGVDPARRGDPAARR